MDQEGKLTTMALVVTVLLAWDPCLVACPFDLFASRGQKGVTLAWRYGENTPDSVRILRDGQVIAPAVAPVPSSYTDTRAEPGRISYEVRFSMPGGDGCPPLTTWYDACITELQATQTERGVVKLSWANNLNYDGIEISRDGEVIETALSGANATYTDTAAPEDGSVTYAVAPTNGTCTPSVVDVAIDVRCFLPAPPCDVPPGGPDAELVRAFAFGVHRPFVPGEWCLSYNDDTTPYTPVEHTSPETLQYSAERGWGYEVLYDDHETDSLTPYGNRSGFEIFGPFDSTPNDDRNEFTDNTCPEELYDSFIGGKDFLARCSEAIVGDRDTPCAEAPIEPPMAPDGIIFRVDVPNGRYRFVSAVGSVNDHHASRIVAEDGGSGPPAEITPNHVVLVSNFDQAQYAKGDVAPIDRARGVFARVGFNGLIPPPGDDFLPSPQFINMDEDGTPTNGCPNSPALTVMQGHIRFHQLQGNSNDGCGGGRDPNGGNFVILEIWRVGDETSPTPFKRGDANRDGGVNISDAVHILQHLFAQGPPVRCPDAADSNDDEDVNLTDAIYILQNLFMRGPAIPRPHPDCGTDPTPHPQGGHNLADCSYNAALCKAQQVE